VLSLGRTAWFAMREDPDTLAELPLQLPDTNAGNVFAKAFFDMFKEKFPETD